MFEILVILAKSVPVIAVLWLAINYFLNKEKTYVAQINKLQEELRSNEKETIIMLNRLTTTLDKVVENSAEDKQEIMAEIKSIHKDLAKKISDLKAK